MKVLKSSDKDNVLLQGYEEGAIFFYLRFKPLSQPIVRIQNAASFLHTTLDVSLIDKNRILLHSSVSLMCPMSHKTGPFLYGHLRGKKHLHSTWFNIANNKSQQISYISKVVFIKAQTNNEEHKKRKTSVPYFVIPIFSFI